MGIRSAIYYYPSNLKTVSVYYTLKYVDVGAKDLGNLLSYSIDLVRSCKANRSRGGKVALMGKKYPIKYDDHSRNISWPQTGSRADCGFNSSHTGDESDS